VEAHVSGMPFRLDVVETGEQWVATCTTPHGKAVSRIPAPLVGPLHVPVKTRCGQWMTAADRGNQRSDRRSSRWHSEPHSDMTTIGCAQANNAMPMRGVSQMAKDSDPLISARAMALFASYLSARPDLTKAKVEARRPQTVRYVLDIENIPNQQGGIAEDELLHRQAERQTRDHAGARTGTREGERRMRPNKS